MLSSLPQKLFSLSVTLQPKTLNTIRKLYQRCFEKPAAPLTLLQKLGDRYSSFGVGVDQSLIALLHRWRNAFRLAELIRTQKTAIENFVYEYSEVIGIKSMYWVALDGLPARFCHFWRRVPPRVWHKTSITLAMLLTISIDSGSRAPTYIIASSSFTELSTSKPASFHSPLSLVKTDEARTQP
jgi:hypothetical protein